MTVTSSYSQDQSVTVSKTPMVTTTKLDKDEQGKNIDIKLYRSMIDSLLYLSVSRPDIMFSICVCTRFHSCPKKSHLSTITYYQISQRHYWYGL